MPKTFTLSIQKAKYFILFSYLFIGIAFYFQWENYSLFNKNLF